MNQQQKLIIIMDEDASAVQDLVLPSADMAYHFYGGNGSSQPDEITFDGSDNVTAFADSSANGYGLTKAGAGNITYEQSVEGVGRGALVFPGNAYLERVLASAILANEATFSMYVVYSSTALGARTLVSESQSGNDIPFLRTALNPESGSSDAAGFQHRDDANALAVASTSADALANDGNIHILTLRRTPSGYEIRIDGGAYTNDTATAISTTTINRLTIGALVRASISQYLPGNIFLAAGYTADNYAVVEPLLLEHYDVAMPPFSVAITHSSSIDALSLSAQVVYQSEITNQPILVVMHGFSGVVSDFTEATQRRFAAYGVFAIFVEMRGRGLSDGSEDASSREIQDIIDAVEYVKAQYSSVVDADNINVVGYSGGGGNVFAALAKFPDYFNVGVSFFGVSDYGYDAIDGWYNNGASGAQQTLMDTWIGGNPAAVADAYEARNHVDAVANNYSSGHLFMYHDEDDASVPVVNSQNVADAMDGASKTNYTLNISTALDAVRWTHGLPNSGDVADLIEAEDTFITPILNDTYPAWTIPASGNVIVAGYIVTKRFSIWLGTTTEAGSGGGLDEYATVTYNTATGEYTVTPLTGTMDVFIKQGALTATQNISAETTLTVE